MVLSHSHIQQTFSATIVYDNDWFNVWKIWENAHIQATREHVFTVNWFWPLNVLNDARANGKENLSSLHQLYMCTMQRSIAGVTRVTGNLVDCMWSANLQIYRIASIVCRRRRLSTREDETTKWTGGKRLIRTHSMAPALQHWISTTEKSVGGTLLQICFPLCR